MLFIYPLRMKNTPVERRVARYGSFYTRSSLRWYDCGDFVAYRNDLIIQKIIEAKAEHTPRNLSRIRRATLIAKIFMCLNLDIFRVCDESRRKSIIAPPFVSKIFYSAPKARKLEHFTRITPYLGGIFPRYINSNNKILRALSLEPFFFYFLSRSILSPTQVNIYSR